MHRARPQAGRTVRPPRREADRARIARRGPIIEDRRLEALGLLDEPGDAGLAVERQEALQHGVEIGLEDRSADIGGVEFDRRGLVDEERHARRGIGLDAHMARHDDTTDIPGLPLVHRREMVGAVIDHDALRFEPFGRSHRQQRGNGRGARHPEATPARDGGAANAEELRAQRRPVDQRSVAE